MSKKYSDNDNKQKKSENVLPKSDDKIKNKETEKQGPLEFSPRQFDPAFHHGPQGSYLESEVVIPPPISDENKPIEKNTTKFPELDENENTMSRIDSKQFVEDFFAEMGIESFDDVVLNTDFDSPEFQSAAENFAEKFHINSTELINALDDYKDLLEKQSLDAQEFDDGRNLN